MFMLVIFEQYLFKPLDSVQNITYNYSQESVVKFIKFYKKVNVLIS